MADFSSIHQLMELSCFVSDRLKPFDSEYIRSSPTLLPFPLSTIPHWGVTISDKSSDASSSRSTMHSIRQCHWIIQYVLIYYHLLCMIDGIQSEEYLALKRQANVCFWKVLHLLFNIFHSQFTLSSVSKKLKLTLVIGPWWTWQFRSTHWPPYSGSRGVIMR